MIYNLMKDSIFDTNYLKKRKEGKFLIVSSNNLEIYYLDEVAKEFFSLIDGESNLEEIIHELLKIYEVKKEVLIKDIINLIRDFQWKGLLVIVED